MNGLISIWLNVGSDRRMYMFPIHIHLVGSLWDCVKEYLMFAFSISLCLLAHAEDQGNKNMQLGTMLHSYVLIIVDIDCNLV